MATLTCPSTDLNFLTPTGFILVIERLPKVSFFAQNVTLPTVSLVALEQQTPLSRIEIPSDRLEFGSLTINFIVDEQMNNYMEVFNWMKGLGFPELYPQYTIENNRGLEGTSELQRNYSEAKLIILGSNKAPVRTVNFYDCFPTSLSGFETDSTATDIQYIRSTLELEYSYFDIA